MPRSYERSYSSTYYGDNVSSSSTTSTTPPSSRRYVPASSLLASYYSSSSGQDYSSYGGTSSYTASHLYRPTSPSTFTSRSSGRPFRSRFLRHREDSANEKDQPTSTDEKSEESKEAKEGDNKLANLSSKARRKLLRNATVLNDGSVIRVRRERSTDDEETEEESSEEEGDSNDAPEADQQPEEEEEEEVKEPTPEPEDPLDIEERELNNQLMMSLTLTLVDEENIRQRLVEIRKTRLRRNLKNEHQMQGGGLASKFQKSADVVFFENQPNVIAKEEEEKILIGRLENEPEMSEVEQRDVCVRLQEIFRDRKEAIAHIVEKIEQQYEHIVQETTTELTELETSINGKTELIDKLQQEILSMTVKKEILSKQVEEVNETHSDRNKCLQQTSQELDEKISKYSVIHPRKDSGDGDTKESDKKTSNQQEKKRATEVKRSGELKEIEAELECPVCMEVSRPPIYQCEEGHIICSNCKPLLKVCPHNCGQKYSEPAIRCRFAEKLADKYFTAIASLTQ